MAKKECRRGHPELRSSVDPNLAPTLYPNHHAHMSPLSASNLKCRCPNSINGILKLEPPALPVDRKGGGSRQTHDCWRERKRPSGDTTISLAAVREIPTMHAGTSVGCWELCQVMALLHSWMTNAKGLLGWKVTCCGR